MKKIFSALAIISALIIVFATGCSKDTHDFSSALVPALENPLTLLDQCKELTNPTMDAQSAGGLVTSRVMPAGTKILWISTSGSIVNSSQWNGGQSFYAPGVRNMFSVQELNMIARMVIEDYWAYNVRVISDEDSAAFYAAPMSARMKCIVTKDIGAMLGYSQYVGVAYTNSFLWCNDTPCFIFVDQVPAYNYMRIGSLVSHELGHTFGLHHAAWWSGQTLLGSYDPGEGALEDSLSYGPIMGNSIQKQMASFKKARLADGTWQNQDSILTERLGRVPDDYGNLFDEAEVIHISTNGPIHTRADATGFVVGNDKDLIKVSRSTTKDQGLSLKSGASIAGVPNIDLRVRVYDHTKTLKFTFDSPTSCNAWGTLPKGSGGIWYLRIDQSPNTPSDYLTNRSGQWELKVKNII